MASSRNFRKPAATSLGYGNCESPVFHVSATNAPFTIVGSGLFTSGSFSPISFASWSPSSPRYANAEPVANACPSYSSWYALPPKCGSFSSSSQSSPRRKYAAESPAEPAPMITMPARLVTGGSPKRRPSRISWQIALCSPSTLGDEECSAGADSSVLSSGHPDSTDPATMNFTKSRRDELMAHLGNRGRFGGKDRYTARANAVPHNNQNHGHAENER